MEKFQIYIVEQNKSQVAENMNSGILVFLKYFK